MNYKTCTNAIQNILKEYDDEKLNLILKSDFKMKFIFYFKETAEMNSLKK